MNTHYWSLIVYGVICIVLQHRPATLATRATTVINATLTTCDPEATACATTAQVSTVTMARALTVEVATRAAVTLVI